MLSSLRSKLELPPRWNKLARIRELAVTRSTGLILVAVPSLGAIKIVLLENTKIDISIPFNFVLLYFAALLTLAASSWFDLRCPSVVKSCKTYPKFFKESQMLGVEILTKHAELADKQDAVLDDIVDKLLGEDETVSDQNTPSGLHRYTAELTKTNMLWRTAETWDSENGSLTHDRRLIIVLYGISAALGLWVALVDAPIRVIGAL